MSLWVQRLLYKIAWCQVETALRDSCNSSEKYSFLVYSHTHTASLSHLVLDFTRKWGNFKSCKKLNLALSCSFGDFKPQSVKIQILLQKILVPLTTHPKHTERMGRNVYQRKQNASLMFMLLQALKAPLQKEQPLHTALRSLGLLRFQTTFPSEWKQVYRVTNTSYFEWILSFFLLLMDVPVTLH